MLSKLLKWSLILLLMILFKSIYAEEYPIQIEDAKINTHDVKSIQRGAKFFATTCMICHSLDLMAHDPIARAAGITPDKMPDKSKNWWYGTAPPDLSLIAKIRSADWLYTYLHVFYKDRLHATGSNNLLVDNINMPNPFLGLQGEQALIVKKSDLFEDYPPLTQKLPYYAVLRLTHKGSVSPDEFDRMIRDLVNFLVYTSEPKKYSRDVLGIWVLLFLAVLFILIYLLKRSYWKTLK